MLGILYHIRKFLLSALKRYSPGRLLQYLLALCRAVFSRCKSNCSGQDSSHESLQKTLTLSEGKKYLSEGGIVTPIGHVISACRTPSQMEAGVAQVEEGPTQVEEGPAQNEEASPPCVCHRLLPIIYANHYHLILQGMTDLNHLSDRRVCALKVTLHSKMT